MGERDVKICENCLGPNPVWRAPNALWKFAMAYPGEKNYPRGIICPLCFIERAEKRGVMPIWHLSEGPLSPSQRHKSKTRAT